jgi:hypothetical protein
LTDVGSGTLRKLVEAAEEAKQQEDERNKFRDEIISITGSEGRGKQLYRVILLN